MAFSQIIGIEQYLWFLGNIDLMINSLATFIMLRPNRSYTSQIIFCGCFNWSCMKCINCKCQILINIMAKIKSSSSHDGNDKDPHNTTQHHFRVSSNEKIEGSAVSTDHLKQSTSKPNVDRDRDGHEQQEDI
mmetsp:Transcript_28675/g.25335  ORF Transcript_28675/g.25335 Transcript_28675/m.25335 type:complete len:132 (-) Transcript_28675:115-510(-)